MPPPEEITAMNQAALRESPPEYARNPLQRVSSLVVRGDTADARVVLAQDQTHMWVHHLTFARKNGLKAVFVNAINFPET